MRLCVTRQFRLAGSSDILLRFAGTLCPQTTVAGEVAEWSNALDSKSSVRLGVPSVRIRPSPPMNQVLTHHCQPPNQRLYFFARDFLLANLCGGYRIVNGRNGAAADTPGLLLRHRRIRHFFAIDRGDITAHAGNQRRASVPDEALKAPVGILWASAIHSRVPSTSHRTGDVEINSRSMIMLYVTCGW